MSWESMRELYLMGRYRVGFDEFHDCYYYYCYCYYTVSNQSLLLASESSARVIHLLSDLRLGRAERQAFFSRASTLLLAPARGDKVFARERDVSLLGSSNLTVRNMLVRMELYLDR